MTSSDERGHQSGPPKLRLVSSEGQKPDEDVRDESSAPLAACEEPVAELEVGGPGSVERVLRRDQRLEAGGSERFARRELSCRSRGEAVHCRWQARETVSGRIYGNEPHSLLDALQGPENRSGDRLESLSLQQEVSAFRCASACQVDGLS